MQEPDTLFLHPESAKDCYDIAKERGISESEAHKIMIKEGWKYWGLSAEYGTELYLPPKTETKRLADVLKGLEALPEGEADLKEDILKDIGKVLDKLTKGD